MSVNEIAFMPLTMQLYNSVKEKRRRKKTLVWSTLF